MAIRKESGRSLVALALASETMTVVIGKSHEREVSLVVLKSLCFAVTN